VRKTSTEEKKVLRRVRKVKIPRRRNTVKMKEKVEGERE